MVEETQNQQPLKRIKAEEEEEEEEEEDRISSLPDCLIDEILSRLPSTIQAIRTGVLSKRWQHIWTYVSTLVFLDNEFYLSRFFPFVNATLSQCRQTKLNKFKIILRSHFGFESHVRSWIHYAIRCNVEEFDLNLISNLDFVLDELFFTSSSFTHLKLTSLRFKPSTAITWGNLKSLHIFYGVIDEDFIRNIFSGSPLLETLKLNSCYIPRPLDITSNSVKNLVLSNLYHKFRYKSDEFYDFVVINAPNLLSIKIKGSLWLPNLLLQNVSSLVKAKLDYKNYGYKEGSEEMLKGLLVSLRHVKEVKIGISCFKILSSLKDKGFIPSLNLKLPMNEAVFFDNDLVSNSH